MTAPALIAGTLNSTSLSLEWDIPKRFTEITKTNVYHKSYLVQWRFEELAGDWKLCRNQSMGENSTVKVENLHPYTKYRVRILIISHLTFNKFYCFFFYSFELLFVYHRIPMKSLYLNKA